MQLKHISPFFFLFMHNLVSTFCIIWRNAVHLEKSKSMTDFPYLPMFATQSSYYLKISMYSLIRAFFESISDSLGLNVVYY